jgi:membrane associated rhomboid family serine protease
MQNKLLQQKWTISNSLMIISVIFTLLTFVIPSIYRFGMNDVFFNAGLYYYWFIQMFTSQFLHGGITHLAMNAIFILYFGNVLERSIGKDKMLIFFISCSVFLWVFLTLLNTWNTVWISGFALAVLTYYTLMLWKKWNPEYTGWVTAIIINILIWLSPGISFFGHFGWMIFGALWWYFCEKKK